LHQYIDDSRGSSSPDGQLLGAIAVPHAERKERPDLLHVLLATRWWTVSAKAARKPATAFVTRATGER
jgi:hypothetical protein